MAKQYYVTMVVYDKNNNLIESRISPLSENKEFAGLDVENPDGSLNYVIKTNPPVITYAQHIDFINRTTEIMNEDADGNIKMLAKIGFDEEFLRTIEINNRVIYTGVIYCEDDKEAIRLAINAKAPLKSPTNNPFTRVFNLSSSSNNDAQPSK